MRRTALLGFLYDLRRTLLSVPLLLCIVLLVASSFGVLATLAATSQSAYTVTNQADYFFTSGQVHVLLYSFDSFGRPVEGVSFQLTFLPLLGDPPGTSPGSVQGQTGPTGIVELSTGLSDAGYTVDIDFSDPSSSGSVSAILAPEPVGDVVALYGGVASAVASGTGLSSTQVLQVFYSGPGGTAPPDYQVYWAGPFSAESPPGDLPESSMTYVGTISTYHQTFPLTVPSSSTSATGSSAKLLVELFSSSGALIARDLNQSSSNFAPSQTAAKATDAAFSFVETILAFFVPVMAILAAYTTYGKDRVTGVLESALCRPVSWLGLSLSRYLSVLVALSLALLVGVGVIDGLVDWAVGTPLTGSVVGAVAGSLILEVGAFVGIIFVLAYLVRSSSSLIGGAIGIWVLFGIAWNTLAVDLAVASGDPVGSPAYVDMVTALEFVSPADFGSLAQSIVTGTAVSALGSTTTAAPAISPLALVAVGLLWVVVPLVVFLYLVQTRD